MTVRYGKPSGGYLAYNKRYFSEQDNAEALDVVNHMAELYRAQPLRHSCMLCGGPLDGPDFVLRGIPYVRCGTCSHINGRHEETEAYIRGVAAGAYGAHVSRYYESADRAAFDARIDRIYKAKAEFLVETLRQAGEDPAALRYADLGAGTGYFVGALRQQGLASVVGYDSLGAQVETGNALLGEPLLVHTDINDIIGVVGGLDCQVASFIFVLEHVQHPRATLKALQENSNIRYAFIAVPTFGVANVIDGAFPAAVARHSAGHSHFFTPESLEWVSRDLGMEILSTWWFGADVVDLVRSMSITLGGTGGDAAAREVEKMLLPLIDPLQLVVDQARLSSEVHLVVRVNR